jgi:predicted metal-dependent hydrolase
VEIAPTERALPEFALRQSRRARRLTLRVYPGGRVEVTVPVGVTPSEVERFVRRHTAWIETRIARYAKVLPGERDVLPERVTLPALEDDWELRYIARARSGFKVVSDRVLELYGDTSQVAQVRRELRAWLTQQAQQSLGAWLFEVASETGFRFTRVQVRRQRTRWGSCSRSGTLSLNVCLLFQRPEVVRYLFVHELCHTVQMNHSDRFWNLVQTHEPDYQRLDRELSRGWQQVPDWVFS